MERKKPLIVVTIFLTVLITFAVGVRFYWDQNLASPSNDATKKEFIIEAGEGTTSIVDRLEQEGLIRNAFIFKLYLRQSGLGGTLQAGRYELSPNMDSATIVETLSHGTFDTKITLIEGWRKEEIADYLSQNLGLKKDDLVAAAEEGYLFPDTYLVSKSATVSALIKIFRENFEKKLSAELREDLTKNDLSLEETITLASIVEREGKNDQDRSIIAGILLKRLKEGMALEADATVQYALGYQKEEKTWWKKSLTEEDLEIPSPYNTRANVGLPPSPIASPGIKAIRAVIYPQETPYWFYIHDSKGVAYYARTLEEHNLNIARFL